MLRFFLPVIFIGLVTVPQVPLYGDKNGNNKDNNNQRKAAQERLDQKKINAEKEDVAEVKAKLAEAQKEVHESEENLKAAQESVQKSRRTKDELEQQLEQSAAEKLGMNKALEAQKAAQEEFNYAAKPVLEALQKRPEFVAALKAESEAKKKIDMAKDNQERQEAARSLDAAAGTLDRLKKDAMAASPALKVPQEKLEAARKVVTDLRARIKQEVAEAPQLQRATKAWEQAMSEQEKAKSKLENVRQKVASIQRKLAAEQSQVQQAIAKDRANDNKGNKKVR